MASNTGVVRLKPVPCIITNETDPVDHYPALNTPNRELSIWLAHAWGMRPDHEQIHPHTLGNGFHLRSDFQQTYNKGNWALVPCSTTLKDIAVKALMLGHSAEPYPSYLDSFPIVEGSYHFVYFYGSPSVFIRVNDDYLENGDSFVVHKKPFGNLPTIQASVHPYFVIADVAQKVLRQRKEKLQVNEQSNAIQECLDLCVVIYNQWLILKNTYKSTVLKPPQPHSSPGTKASVQQPDSSRPAQARKVPMKAAVAKRVWSDSEEDVPLSSSSAVPRSRVKRG